MAIATPSSRDDQPSPSAALIGDSLAMGVLFALILTVVQRGVGFVRGLLFCRFMTDQELGQWSMVWSFLLLLAPLAVLGLPGCFGRYVEHFRQRGQLRNFIRRVGIVSVAMTTLFSLGVLWFAPSVSQFIFRDPGHTDIIWALGLAILFVAAFNFLTSLMEALRQVRLVTWMRFLLGISFAAIGTGLLAWSEHATMAVTAGYGISCLVAAVPAIWFLARFRNEIIDHVEPLPRWSFWSRIAPFAFWLWFSNLFFNLFEVADRYMLIHWSPVSAELAQGMVGQYHSGRVLPLLLVGVSAILGGVLLPYMSAAWERGQPGRARVQQNWTIKLVAIGFTSVGWILVSLAPWLFDTVLQGRYEGGLAVLPLTMVYCIWVSLMTVGQDYLWVAEKGKFAVLVTAIGLAVNLSLNAWMIPLWGVGGAVLATSLANLGTVAGILALNHWFGCRTDLGIWLVLAVPLVLLLEPAQSGALLAVVVLAAFSTPWIFNQSEREQLVESRDRLLQRFGF